LEEAIGEETIGEETIGEEAIGEETIGVDAPVIDGVDELRACWVHEGEGAELVRALKYGRVTALVTAIADAMAQIAPSASAVSIVTWVPCTPRRRRKRGFDPAELLARALARRLRRKARACLRRLDDRPQTSRSREGRLVGPQLRGRSMRRGMATHVLLVDDVCTTGSTLKVAASALRACGAQSVSAVVATVAERPSSGGSVVERGAAAACGEASTMMASD